MACKASVLQASCPFHSVVAAVVKINTEKGTWLLPYLPLMAAISPPAPEGGAQCSDRSWLDPGAFPGTH